MPVYGMIGGSGLYEMPGLEIVESVMVSTPFGEPSGRYRVGRLSGKEVVFLPRHGEGHRLQPNRINYRANLWGFRQLGVSRILAVGASGGISSRVRPGSVAMPDQIIDMTSGRACTFFDGDEVVHVDFTEPFCVDLRAHLRDAARRAAIDLTPSGVYVCVNGPRLETAAEIRTFAAWGADMVGMTAMPETILARELELCFASLSVITNYAAGISGERLTAEEVVKEMTSSSDKIGRVLESFFSMELPSPKCLCNKALNGARM